MGQCTSAVATAPARSPNSGPPAGALGRPRHPLADGGAEEARTKQVLAAARAVPSQADEEVRRVGPLAQYFGGPYLEGKILEQADRAHYKREWHKETGALVYRHRKSGIRVWEDALDLRSYGCDLQKPSVVLFHYTSFAAFAHVTSDQLTAAELYALLLREHVRGARGLYVTSLEPAVFRDSARVLLSSYLAWKSQSCKPSDCTESPGGLDQVLRDWGSSDRLGQADFCVPLLVPQDLAWNLQVCQQAGSGSFFLGGGTNGRGQHPSREVWLVRLDLEDPGKHRDHHSIELVRRIERHSWRLEEYLRCFGDRDKATLLTMNAFGCLLQAQGCSDQAAKLFHEAQQRAGDVIRDKRPSSLTGISDVALMLKVRGRLEWAEPLYRQVLTAFREVLGNRHSHTLTSINNLATLLKARGEFDESEMLYREVLRTRREVLGDTQPDTLVSLSNLAGLLKARNCFQEAEPLLMEAWQGFREALGDGHPNTLACAYRLAVLLEAMGRDQDAETVFRQELAGCEALYGKGHQQHTLASASNLVRFLGRRGQAAKALALERECGLRVEAL